MSFFESVKSTVGTAVDAVSCAAQSVVERNRTNAKLNRLRTIMKSESELMNRAYIALGKHYYESVKNGNELKPEDTQKIFEVIEASKSKIAKARVCYRNIVDSQNDIFYGSVEAPEYDSSDVVDITVACSNENEYESSPFEQSESAEQEPEASADEPEKEDGADDEAPSDELF